MRQLKSSRSQDWSEVSFISEISVFLQVLIEFRLEIERWFVAGLLWNLACEIRRLSLELEARELKVGFSIQGKDSVQL